MLSAKTNWITLPCLKNIISSVFVCPEVKAFPVLQQVPIAAILEFSGIEVRVSESLLEKRMRGKSTTHIV